MKAMSVLRDPRKVLALGVLLLILLLGGVFAANAAYSSGQGLEEAGKKVTRVSDDELARVFGRKFS